MKKKTYIHFILRSIAVGERTRIFLFLLTLLPLACTIDANAKKQTSYGRLYNVQDYIDSAPGTGANQTTLGIKRCLSTVMHSIYAYCNSNSNNTPKSYTIVFPAGNYTINDELHPVKIQGGNMSIIWERPLVAETTNITINVIGLNIDNVTLKVKMSEKLPSNNTQIQANYDNSGQYYYVPNSYTANGIESNPDFDEYINGNPLASPQPIPSKLIDLNMTVGTSPSDPNFLQYTATTMPIIFSENNVAHRFFRFETIGAHNSLSAEPYNLDPNSPNFASNPNRKLFNTTINVCGIKLIGINDITNNTAVYGPNLTQHNNTFVMGCGVLSKNMKSVYIDNMIVENIYGNGIIVDNKSEAYINGDVIVSNNVIKDVWGLRYKKSCTTPPAYDDMGDGISFAGIDNGISEKNYIVNDIAYTKQYGRIGLATCSEHNRGTKATHNYIKGYDRGIHSENNLSGFTISENRIVGSETGIVFDGNRDYEVSNTSFCPAINISNIKNNYISNEEIDYSPYLQKIYPPHLFFSPQAHRSNEYWGSQIQENEFVLDRQNTFIYTNDNINYSCPSTDPRPWGPVNNIDRYHIYSGLRAQEIMCNLFRTLNTNNIPNKLGGLYLRSFCPNENYDPNIVLCPAPNGTDCQPNQYLTHTTPIKVQDNVFLNCDKLSFIKYNSSISNVNGNVLNNSNKIYVEGMPLSNYTANPPNPPQLPQCVPLTMDMNLISVSNMGCNNPTNTPGEIDATLLSTLYTITCTPSNGVTQSGGLFLISQAGTYTITATSISTPASTMTKTVIITAPSANHCCNPVLASKAEVVLLPNNSTPATIQSIIGGSLSISNQTFYIDGIFTIDDNVSFTDCIFYFTANSIIQLTPNHTLTMNGCTLQAACDELWNGILADDPSEQVVITNSTLRDMQEGVQLVNGAKTNTQHSRFVDNIYGMQFKYTPYGYVTGQGGNQGVVHNNIFSSTGAGPLYGLGLQFTQSMCGIHALGCIELEIGELAALSSNDFKHLYNGIYIEPTNANINSSVRLLNNKYTDIRGFGGDATALQQQQILNTIYAGATGAGVYVSRDITNVKPKEWCFPIVPKVHIESFNYHNVSFTNCDKAVAGLGASVTVKKYKIDNCFAGIMMNDDHYQRFLIQNNKIDNAYIGIQLIGNAEEIKIQANQGVNGGISLRENGTTGIDIRYLAETHIGIADINSNTIELKGKASTGISTFLTGKNVRIVSNTIHMNTTDIADVTGPDNYLTGIRSLQSKGNAITCNTVNGLQSNAIFNNRRSLAISMMHSKDNEISCNQVNNTWFGLIAYGDCITNEKNVRANSMNNHIYGLTTLPGIFSDEGELNDIGLATQDNNNQFNGAYFNANADRTMRWWSNQNAINYRKIFTALSFGNASNYAGGEYQIIQTTVSPQNCLAYTGCDNDNQTPQNVTNIDEGLAMDIAQDSILYYSFPAVSEWVAKYELYTELERDSVLRNSNALLYSFYTTQQAQAIGLLYTTEKLINLLTDSTSYSDSTLFANRLAEAKQSNNAISSTENYIQNAQWVNALLLKTIEYSRDSLSQEEIEQLETLAKSCPSIEGLAVYKARMLYAYYEPTLDYNDYTICNPQNKNGASLFGDLLQFLSDPKLPPSEKNTGALQHDDYKIYPIPSSETITVKYDFVGEDDATMYIYDILGREIEMIQMSNANSTVSFSVLTIPNGVYTYKIKVGKETKTGKIQILK